MCLGFFNEENEENQFKDIHTFLKKEYEIVKNLIEFSDRLLLRMTAPRMEYDAALCFSEAEECMTNYRLAIKSAINGIIKRYCRFKYKEALDIRTVTSKYLPETRARNLKQLINKLYKESKDEEYHPKNIKLSLSDGPC
ncbi:MAG: hypothetical protein ACPLXC_00665 [Candidatus Pacearchaeota archaeon]